MITAAPFLRYLAEKDISTEQLSQITQIPFERLSAFRRGIVPNQDELDILCRVLNCQPCDVIEFRKTKAGGHWEWIDDQH